jgi:hypothetical protein
MINLSIIIPGIRNNNWDKIYDDLVECVGSYSFELICVGPYDASEELLSKENFKFIKDFGAPSRCLQIGSQYSNGEFICWIPDDCILDKNSLSLSLDFMYKNATEKDGMCLLYSEGLNFIGDQHLDNSYWIGSTHRDQRLSQVDTSWRIAPLFLYRKNLYDELGGIDCRFEHANMNTHDLAYRVQKLGGVIHLSPTRILSVDWIPNQPVVSNAYFENDLPLFNELYGGNEFPRLKINKDNWKNSPEIWERRFK